MGISVHETVAATVKIILFVTKQMVFVQWDAHQDGTEICALKVNCNFYHAKSISFNFSVYFGQIVVISHT